MSSRGSRREKRSGGKPARARRKDGKKGSSGAKARAAYKAQLAAAKENSIREAEAQARLAAAAKAKEGMENFDAILEQADGIMVARGDLGVEIPIEKVCLAQKMMISRCNTVGKPVITATQMLESMVKNPRPTRAEANDVANAVFDGTDCVMLSGETAKGDYPIEAVNIMGRICRQAEDSIDYKTLYSVLRDKVNATMPSVSVVESITSSAVKTAADLNASLLIALTETGFTGRLIAKYRPEAPTLVLTANEQTARQLMVTRGVFPIIVGSMIGSDGIISRTVAHAKEMGLTKAGELVVATGGRRDGVAGMTNLLKVINVV